jgi:hypothetical protein
MGPRKVLGSIPWYAFVLPPRLIIYIYPLLQDTKVAYYIQPSNEKIPSKNDVTFVNRYRQVIIQQQIFLAVIVSSIFII